MRQKSVVAAIAISLVVLVTSLQAAPFNLALSVGPSLPMGDFGETEDIIEPTFFGKYDAAGGGAETGFGFNIELEVQAAHRVYVGGRFGYSRYGADASDIMDKFLEGTGVSGVDATWAFTTVGVFARITALETPAMSVYGRGGMGASKMKNSVDITISVPEAGDQTISTTADFDLGSQFYFAGVLGLEYRISERVSLVGEFRLTNLRSDGAEATATVMDTSLTGTQVYNATVLDAVFGVRIPLSGI
jgi:opacity protein-like surface antigen